MAKSVAFIGVPYDGGSTFLRGPAEAPLKIREALFCDSGNLYTENGIDLGTERKLIDFGNLDLSGDTGSVFGEIEKNIFEIIDNDLPLISLGGDHSITYPLVKAFNKKYHNLTIIHFDAHPDLYDIYNNDKYTNASPFARIMEEKLAEDMIQIGIRTFTSHQREQAKKFNVTGIEMKNIQEAFENEFLCDTPVYISVDVDCLDPAFAPGVSHPEPGGLSTRSFLQILQGFNFHIVGADIVEFNPSRDINNLTAFTSAKIFKEIAGLILK